MKKRLLSVFLATTMLFSLFSTFVSAAPSYQAGYSMSLVGTETGAINSDGKKTIEVVVTYKAPKLGGISPIIIAFDNTKLDLVAHGGESHRVITIPAGTGFTNTLTDEVDYADVAKKNNPVSTVTLYGLTKDNNSFISAQPSWTGVQASAYVSGRVVFNLMFAYRENITSADLNDSSLRIGTAAEAIAFGQPAVASFSDGGSNSYGYATNDKASSAQPTPDADKISKPIFTFPGSDVPASKAVLNAFPITASAVSGGKTITCPSTNGCAKGYKVMGKIKSYNPKNETTITLYAFNKKTNDYSATATASGKIEATTGIDETIQEFTVASVPSGKYKIVINKKFHIPYIINNIVVGSEDLSLENDANERIKNIRLACGDLDEDGRINYLDSNMVTDSANYNKPAAEAGNSNVNLNGDENVNYLDANIVTDSYCYNKVSTDFIIN